MSQNPVPAEPPRMAVGTKVQGPHVLCLSVPTKDGSSDDIWEPREGFSCCGIQWRLNSGRDSRTEPCHSSPAPPGGESKFQQSLEPAGICRAAAHPKNPKGEEFPWWGFIEGKNPWWKSRGMWKCEELLCCSPGSIPIPAPSAGDC